MALVDAKRAARQRGGERYFRTATLAAALLVLALLGGVVVSLLRGAWPALSHFKFRSGILSLMSSGRSRRSTELS